MQKVGLSIYRQVLNMPGLPVMALLALMFFSSINGNIGNCLCLSGKGMADSGQCFLNKVFRWS